MQVNASAYGMPRAMPVDYAVNRGDQIEVVRLQPRSTGDSFVASDYGMPRALPTDYALASGDQIEVVRALPSVTSSDKIEFVRTQPRSIAGPQVVAAGFDWDDAAIGAGLALGLVLLGWGAALATRHLGRPQTA
jgi:sulfur carrier protein ThiS